MMCDEGKKAKQGSKTVTRILNFMECKSRTRGATAHTRRRCMSSYDILFEEKYFWKKIAQKNLRKM